MKNTLRQVVSVLIALGLPLTGISEEDAIETVTLLAPRMISIPGEAQSMKIELRGADGRTYGSPGGRGRSVTATFAVNPGETINITCSKGTTGAWAVTGQFGWVIAGEGGSGNATQGGDAGAVNAPQSGITGGQGVGGSNSHAITSTNGTWVVSPGASSGFMSTGGSTGPAGNSTGEGQLARGGGNGGDGWGGGGGGSTEPTKYIGYISMTSPQAMPGQTYGGGGGGSGVSTSAQAYIDNGPASSGASTGQVTITFYRNVVIPPKTASNPDAVVKVRLQKPDVDVIQNQSGNSNFRIITN